MLEVEVSRIIHDLTKETPHDIGLTVMEFIEEELRSGNAKKLQNFISELNRKESLCGCGKIATYMGKNGEMSCNKYQRCPYGKVEIIKNI